MSKRALSGTQIDALKAPGNHWVAPSLYLQIRPQGTRSWLFRYERDGRTRWLGLGPAAGIAPVKATEARNEAERLRVVVREGGDPVAEKRAARAEAKKSAAPTFGWCCAEYIAAHEASWSFLGALVAFAAGLDPTFVVLLGRRARFVVGFLVIIGLLQVAMTGQRLVAHGKSSA